MVARWEASSARDAAEDSAVVLQVWTDPDVIEWSQLLLNSFHNWTGRELLERVGDPAYQGVRVTSTGHRFLIENALIWNVLDAERQRIGQAATFMQWSWLP